MSLKVDGANCWRISAICNAEDFFRAIGPLVPEATQLYLEGAADADVIAVLQPHIDAKEYAAPVGTAWSWPGHNQRLTVKASKGLFDQLADLATHHAEPEICSHLHLWRDDDALVQWFDAFNDPLLVSKAVPRDRVERFSSQVRAVLLNSAA